VNAGVPRLSPSIPVTGHLVDHRDNAELGEGPDQDDALSRDVLLLDL
jgi:hypothetical protein